MYIETVMKTYTVLIILLLVYTSLTKPVFDIDFRKLILNMSRIVRVFVNKLLNNLKYTCESNFN